MSGMVGQITKTGGTNAITNVPPVIQLKYALPQALLLCSNVNCVLLVFHKFDYCALWPISVARSSYYHRLSSRLSVVCLKRMNCGKTVRISEKVSEGANRNLPAAYPTVLLPTAYE